MSIQVVVVEVVKERLSFKQNEVLYSEKNHTKPEEEEKKKRKKKGKERKEERKKKNKKKTRKTTTTTCITERQILQTKHKEDEALYSEQNHTKPEGEKRRKQKTKNKKRQHLSQ